MTSDSFSLDFPLKDKLFVNVYLDDGVVTGVEFSSSPCGSSIWGNSSCQDRIVSRKAERLIEDLKSYFQGHKIDFKEYPVKLDTSSNFSQKVLEELRNIPYGETVTYGELASRLNSGPRAIGQAVKRNPVPLIIPCHRVVASNGLGGYSSGVDIKKELLKLESADLQ